MTLTCRGAIVLTALLVGIAGGGAFSAVLADSTNMLLTMIFGIIVPQKEPVLRYFAREVAMETV